MRGLGRAGCGRLGAREPVCKVHCLLLPAGPKHVAAVVETVRNGLQKQKFAPKVNKTCKVREE